jgi:release factor glutamine methyltransferase
MTVDSRGLIVTSELSEPEAVRLLSAATGASRAQILVGIDVSQFQAAEFSSMVDRRNDGEPLQYIEGEVPFGPVSIAIDARVLIPRPETEELLEHVRKLVERPKVIVDLCTGSGNLATALAASYPEAKIYATDVAAGAVAVARSNASRNNVAMTVLEGNLFEPLPDALGGCVDLIVANPPYLAESEFEDLPDDVRREPRIALVSGPTGDEVLDRIAAEASKWLRPGGVIVCEISEFHAQRIAALFAPLNGEVLKDFFGKDRFVVGRSRVE